MLGSANFRAGPVMAFMSGNLCYQIEHHLFHKICHVHYPALSKVVEEACREFGVRYAAHRTIFSAIASHFKWLVLMGRPTSLTNQTPAA